MNITRAERFTNRDTAHTTEQLHLHCTVAPVDAQTRLKRKIKIVTVQLLPVIDFTHLAAISFKMLEDMEVRPRKREDTRE